MKLEIPYLLGEGLLPIINLFESAVVLIQPNDRHSGGKVLGSIPGYYTRLEPYFISSMSQYFDRQEMEIVSEEKKELFIPRRTTDFILAHPKATVIVDYDVYAALQDSEEQQKNPWWFRAVRPQPSMFSVTGQNALQVEFWYLFV